MSKLSTQSMIDRPQMRLRQLIKKTDSEAWGLFYTVQLSGRVSAPYNSTDMTIDCRNCSLVCSDKGHEDQTLVLRRQTKATSRSNFYL